MNTTSRRFTVGIALLLIGLSLTTAVNLTVPRTARADPGVLYTAPTAQGSGNCSSWANACTLQTALAQAQSGDEIWVKAGVHYPGPAGNREATFTLKNGVALYGGFAGTETLRNQRNWQANVTILSGDIDRNDNHGGDYINENASQIVGNNAYHVITSGGTDTTAVLDGFIVTAGQANYTGGGVYNYVGNPTLRNSTIAGNYASLSGGGLYTNGWVYDPGGGGGYVAPSNPALTNVTFRGNSANTGGGMYSAYATPFLADVTFSGNSASSGGGMYNTQANPSLTGVTFANNSANFGGGMYNFDHSSPMLTNVVFIGNIATDGCGMYNNGYSNAVLTNVIFRDNHGSRYGGGIFNQNNSNPTLTNVVFSGNWVYDSGGAMYNTASYPVLTNVTFNNNDATYYGGGIYNSNGNPMLKNVILWGNAAANGASIYNNSSIPIISYSDIQGCGGSGGNWNPACGSDGGGNLDADPLFVDAANGNLRLQLTSPAIDAGNNAAVPSGIVTDLDGNPRFVDIPTVPDTGSGTPPIVDMGAYEAQYADVALDKAVLPSTVAPGDVIAFALTLSYTGTIPASDIVIADTLPAFLGDVSVTSTLVVTDTGYLPPYVWQVQDLAPGQSGVITISGVLTLPLATGTYTNTAFISAMGDLLAENNTAVITFTVPNVAPVFTSAPVVTATQGAPYTYTATARDDNGDALTITAPTLPSWLTLVDHSDGMMTLSGVPSNADVGEHPVLLRVADSGGLTDTQAFTITVANLNDAPLFTSAPVLTATQDAPYTYAVVAADPDLIHGDSLSITAPTLPLWLTLQDHGNGVATLSGTPGDDDVGQHLVVLRATDREGTFAEQEFVITVSEKPRCYIYIPLVFRNWQP